MRRVHVVSSGVFLLICAAGLLRGGLGLAAPARAAIRPRPTPTPVAIAYDEISRMAMGQATPPPPGAFPEDYRRIMASINNPPAQPRGMSGMFGRMMSGAMAHMQNPMLAMQNGTLKRVTFYWVKGWIRTDDPAAHQAVIDECNLHRRIILDLAHKTYRIVNDARSSSGASASTSSGMASSPYMQHAAPGTARMTVHSIGKALGPKTIEGIHTQGYDMTNALTMTNATGSCRNGSFSSHVVEYISGIHKPRAYCPLSAAPSRGNGSYTQYGAMGGCRPQIAAHVQQSVHPPVGMLAMYRRSSMSTGSGAPAMAMVLERGNVQWLYNAQIPALFQIPPGFTRAK